MLKNKLCVLLKLLKGKWSSYRYRFVPWLALNLKEKTHRSVNYRNDKIAEDREIITSLIKLYTAIDYAHPKLQPDVQHCETQAIMLQTLGYNIQRKRSSILTAGDGVFVGQGKILAGSLVALYPGTIYKPMEPVFFQSIGNQFIFRCIDGWHIDGKDKGISRRIFKSCVYRDLRWPYFPADLSWLAGSPISPLNCGQYVNNESPEFPCNVTYQECNLPLEKMPIHLRRFLPNIYYSPLREWDQQTNFLRIVALVSVKDIEAGSELFSSYYTLVHK